MGPQTPGLSQVGFLVRVLALVLTAFLQYCKRMEGSFGAPLCIDLVSYSANMFDQGGTAEGSCGVDSGAGAGVGSRLACRLEGLPGFLCGV